MEQSVRIIEIGAMSASATPVADPVLGLGREGIERVLEEVRSRFGGDEDVRRGVELIRGALGRVKVGEGEGVVDGDVEPMSLDEGGAQGLEVESLGSGEEGLFGDGGLWRRRS